MTSSVVGELIFHALTTDAFTGGIIMIAYNFIVANSGNFKDNSFVRISIVEMLLIAIQPNKEETQESFTITFSSHFYVFIQICFLPVCAVFFYLFAVDVLCRFYVAPCDFFPFST